MNEANLILCPSCRKRMMEYETLHCYACGYEDTNLDSHYKKLFDSNCDPSCPVTLDEFIKGKRG